MNLRVGRWLCIALASIATVGSVIFAIRGATLAATVAYALAPLAIFGYGRMRAAESPKDCAPISADAGQEPTVAPISPDDMTPEEKLSATVWGTLGIEGQVHIAGLVVPPIVTAGMIPAMVGGEYYLGAAVVAASGLYLTRLGWIGGLKYDRLAPKVPDLRMLEAGRPWVDLVILALATAVLLWLASESVSAGRSADTSIIAVMGVLCAAALVVPVRTLWRRRRFRRR